jgi:hypothetical protein
MRDSSFFEPIQQFNFNQILESFCGDMQICVDTVSEQYGYSHGPFLCSVCSRDPLAEETKCSHC